MEASAYIILILGLLSIGTLLFIVYNLLRKVESYEEILETHVTYLKNIDSLIHQSKEHVDALDEKGHFQSDDEVGEFFKYMKEIQNNLNNFTIPEDYGQKKSQE